MRLRCASRRKALPGSGSTSVLVVCLAACTVGGQPAPPPSPDRPAPAGTIRLAYPEEPPSLNPVSDPSPGATDILRAVLPSFSLVTPTLAYEPYLLTGQPRVDVAGDRMTVAFRIREDAVWSDGTPITVRDVAFTAEVMRTAPAPRADGFEHLVNVIEDSDLEGRLILSPPLADWRSLFSAGRFVLPAHAAAGGGTGGWNQGPPVSGGPFRIARVVPGRSVILERNPRFFGTRPLVERIEVSFVPDPTTALQLLRDGLVDAVAPMLGISWGRRLGRVAGAQAGDRLGADLVHLAMNDDRLADRSIRRALADAIDRRRFGNVVLRREGEVAQSVLPAGVEGSVPAWRGYGDGSAGTPDVARELSLVYVRSELLELTARYVQAELEEQGVDLELVALESDVYWGVFLLRGRFDLTLIEVRGGPGPGLATWLGPPMGFTDRSVAALAEEAASGDLAALETAQGELSAAVPVLPMFSLRTAMGWRDGIAGIAPNPSADGPLWNAWAWDRPDT
jgi:ABC-type transport system substrate-binding protein